MRAACPGRVTFTGALPRRGLAVSVRCGALVATYLGLGRLASRGGARVAAGDALGTLGAGGRLRLGARRASARRGYVDPLLLLADSAPPLRPPPRPRAASPPPPSAPSRPAPRPAVPLSHPPGAAADRCGDAAGAGLRRDTAGLPWPAYPALALVASALPVGGLVHRRRRRARPTAAAALAVRR